LPKPVVLLMAYGSPNTLDEVGSYLSEIRGGRASTAEDVERLKERYRQVGGRTPLLEITNSQAQELEKKLRKEELADRVYVGMKHWHPFIQDTVREIVQNSADSIVGVALTPHYSKMSIGGYEEAVRRSLAKHNSAIAFLMVKDWHTEPSLIKALANRVRTGLNKLDKPAQATVLFTAHSLPKRAVAPGDPYQSQLLETSELVAESSGVGAWEFAFQSAGEPRDAWLGPQIREQIASIHNRGFKEILVCPVGFVSDHLEILYDLDIEAKRHAASFGMRLERTISLNSDPEFIDSLLATTRSAIERESPLVS
jgi:protoporphyrin/coproporphyrin ferrochelatase